MQYCLRVDVETADTILETVPEEYQTLGGRNLIARILLNEVPPACEPLGRHNKLIIATGLLAGTAASSSGRLSIGAKSPLTWGIKESNSGGITANHMARAGIKFIIIEGLPEDKGWHIVKISSDGVQLLPAEDYAGLGTYEFCQKMRQSYPKSAVTCIGPAGEMLYNGAGVATTDNEGNPGRYCGRGGMGAVMGSKKIKAIVVEGKGKLKFADEQNFRETLKEYTKIVKDAPSSKGFRKLGTAEMVNIVNNLGGLPVRNFSNGHFEQAESICAETLVKNIETRAGEGQVSHACMPGCLIACSNVYVDEHGKTIVSPLEYETIVLMGSNLGISNLDTIARFNYICNDIGVDTIETGAAMGVAMEAGLADFGDEQAVFDFLEEMRKGTPLGRILGNGAAITGEVLGMRNVPQAKGQGFPAYDPRAIKGMGVTYATSAMGADHTAGPTARSMSDHTDPYEQAETSKNLQMILPLFDCTGLCLFSIGALASHPQVVLDLINSRFGWNLDMDWLNEMYIQTHKDEHRFNELAGFTKIDNRLPEAFTERKLPNTETVFDVPGEVLDRVVDFD